MNNDIENICIVTAQAEFTTAALNELGTIEKDFTILEDLAPGITLCSVPNTIRFMHAVGQKRPIFVRHIAPVQTTIALQNTEQDIGQLALAAIELPGFRQLTRGIRFAVQTRLVQTDKTHGERAYSGGKVNQMLAEAISEETGAIESIKKPEVVISLLCTMQKGYIGISTAEENLSSWPGGARHFAQTDQQLSRAEFKLLEALEVFNVDLPATGRALDLGAAPGGWTRLLLEHGLDVIAIDPAKLDPRLSGNRHLQHYRTYAEDYLLHALQKHERYEIIVNDMRMDARDAARLLAQAAQCLRRDGIIISVLKLPHATPEINPLATLKAALYILKGSYGIVQAHQLFHNRQEVTVVAAQPITHK